MLLKFLLSTFYGIFFFCFPLPAVKASATTGGDVNIFKSLNGIKIIHRKIDKLPIVSICIFAKGGVLFEKKENYGITSLMQSLLTKGTKNRSAEEIAAETESMGTAISAGADKDFATTSISSLKEHILKTAEILSDVIINPAFVESEIKKEKIMAMASLKARKDKIFTVADDISNLSFYGKHPYALPEIGTEEAVKKIKRKDLLDWHKKVYCAENIVISIAGDIDEKEASEVVEKYFKDIPSAKPLGQAETKVEIRKKDTAQKRNFKQAYIMFSYPAPKVGEEDYASLKLLVAALGGRMSGRLFRRLRENLSLAYEVNAFYPTRIDSGRFTFYIGLDKKNIKLARDEFKKIIEEIKTVLIPHQELEETKKYLKGVYMLQRQTVGKRAWYNGFWEIMGKGANYDQKYLTELMAVEAEEIKAAAVKHFSNNSEVIVEIIPKKP